MRKLMILTAAIVTATAIASSAKAEGETGCDPSLPEFAVQSNTCRGWDKAWLFGPTTYGFAMAPLNGGTRDLTRREIARSRNQSGGRSPQQNIESRGFGY